MEVFMTLTILEALKRLPWKIMTVMEATIGVVLMVSDSGNSKLYCVRLAANQVFTWPVGSLNNSKQQQRFFNLALQAARLRAHYSMSLPSNAVAIQVPFFSPAFSSFTFLFCGGFCSKFTAKFSFSHLHLFSFTHLQIFYMYNETLQILPKSLNC